MTNNIIFDMYESFENCARTIPGFIVGQKEDVPYDITELANAYCKAVDNNDEIKKNQYISALMVRYWHMVSVIYEQSKSTRLEVADIVSWLYEAFEKAFTYRSWQDRTKSISRDPKGAEKVINRCIYSVRNYWYQVFNKDKRKINFMTYSLNDNPSKDFHPSSGVSSEKDYFDILPSYDEFVSCGRDIVQKYINDNRMLEAFVVDAIMYQDCFTSDTFEENTGNVDEEGNPIIIEHTEYTFCSQMVSKIIKGINASYIHYFASTYDVDEDELIKAVAELKSYNKAKFGNKLKKAKEYIKNDKEVLDWLCSQTY